MMFAKRSQFIVICFLILGSMGIYLLGFLNSEKLVNKGETINQKLVIASCPTCYDLASKLDDNKYIIIKTNSTAESIKLLSSGKVDSIFAGRTLKPSEPLLEAYVIKNGYSFISETEQIVKQHEMNEYEYFTDLNVDQIKKLFSIDNVVAVDNVYQYLNKGIVITTWENTDLTKAQMVHMVDGHDNRLADSRQPTLYCPGNCDPQLVADITRIK